MMDQPTRGGQRRNAEIHADHDLSELYTHLPRPWSKPFLAHDDGDGMRRALSGEG
jgi:hypothetical protein